MLDNITLKIYDYSPSQFQQMGNKISLNTELNSNKIIRNWKGMRIEYYPNSRQLVMKNSIHKLYNRLFDDETIQNTNRFCFSMFSEVSEKLSNDIFNVDTSKISIGGYFEFGVNIKLKNIKPWTIIDRYRTVNINSVNSFYTVPPKFGKPIQRTAYFTDLRIKCYDKSVQAQIIEKNIFRYEIAITKLRKVKQILNTMKISLKELQSRKNWEILSEYLIEIYDKIYKIPFYNTSSLEDLMTNYLNVYCYSDSLIYPDLKRNLSDSNNKKVRKILKQKYLEHASDYENVHYKVREMMIDELSFLCLN